MVVGSVTEMTIWRITSLWPLREKNVHKNCELRGGPCFRTSELMAHRGYLYIYWVIITQLLLCLIWTFTTGTEDIWQISLTFSDVCYQSKKHCPKPNSESGRVQSTPALSPAYNKQNHVFTFSVCINFWEKQVLTSEYKSRVSFQETRIISGF